MPVSVRLFQTAGILIISEAWAAGLALAGDCDRNGVDDAADIQAGTYPDCNGNAVPDRCEFKPIIELDGPSALQVGENPESVLLTDLDHDSRTDLIIKNLGAWDSSSSRNVSATLSVFLNRGDGKFQAAPEVAAGDSLNGLCSGDLDGDGGPDLAIANFGKWDGSTYVGCAISVLSGLKDGTFKEPIPVAEGCTKELGLADLAAADLDRDGDLDLASAESVYGGVTLLWNQGGFAFKLQRPIGTTPCRFLRAADLDGDLITDLAVIGSENFHSPLAVLINHGDGSFAPAKFSGAGPGAWDPQLVDLDLDGDLDLAALNPSADAASLVWNSGAGDFSLRTIHHTVWSPRSLVATDLDGDRASDLLISADRPTRVWVSFNRGAGTFDLSVGVPTALPLTSLAAGDLDGDGRADLTGILSSERQAQVLLNRTTPILSADCNRNGIPDRCDLDSGISLDRNADGIPDECPLCPVRGDTHATGLTADVDQGFSSGTVHAQAQAVDESGDPITYLFIADGWRGSRVIGPQPEENATFSDLPSGPWTISVLVDDDPACSDGTPDASKTTEVYITHVDFRLLRGDTVPDGVLDITDPVVIFNYLFLGYNMIGCLAAADANRDERVDISDAIFLLGFMFLGSTPPPHPFPSCGYTEFESDWRLGCGGGSTGC